MNFSQWKVGHTHDISADSQNCAGVREPSMHTHFIFRFENGQGNQSLISIHDQNTAETSQHKLRRRTIDAIDRACPQGLQRLWEKFGAAWLSRKKANFVDRRKLLFWEATNIKKPNTTDLERDLQRPRLMSLTIDRGRERPLQVDRAVFFLSFSAFV